MAHLKYYQTEREKYREAYGQKLSDRQGVEIVIKKLLRHFKLRDVYIHFTTGNRHSTAGNSSILINMSWGNNFGVVAHEVAHTYQRQKLYENHTQGEKYHTKEHDKIFKRMVNYCKKKNWFKEEIERRTAEKPKKILSQDEVKKKELIRLEEKIKQYERKVKTYTKKLSRAKKSYKMRLRHLSKVNQATGNDISHDNEASDGLVSPMGE